MSDRNHSLFTSKTFLLLAAVLLFASCSKNEDDSAAPSGGGGGGTTGGQPTLGYSYIHIDVQGPALSVFDTISLPAVVDPGQLLISGAMFETTTPEGVQQVIGLVYAYGFDKTVEMSIPAEIGSNAMGSFTTTSTGVITETPTFMLNIDYAEAFYDNDGDLDNDILTNLLSTANTAVTVTDLEVSNGAVDFLKGSISGTMEMKVFVDPVSEPAIITHTITGTFEYHAL